MINYGEETESKVLSYMKSIQISPIGSGPGKKDFSVISFFIPQARSRLIIRRETYTLFDLFGEIGGLVEFFDVVISGIIRFFSSEEVTAKASNRLYSSDQ